VQVVVVEDEIVKLLCKIENCTHDQESDSNKMRYTGTLSAHHQNVTDSKNCEEFEYIEQQQPQAKCKALPSSESETSTALRNNRWRRKAVFASTWTLVLVLTCLVNAIGALHSSSSSLSSVKYIDSSTNYTRSLLDEIEDIPSFDDINDIGNLTLIAGARRQPIYQNEFAVHIFGGNEKANEIAKKYGFTNMGQVSVFRSCSQPGQNHLALAYSQHVPRSFGCCLVYRKKE
jgi:hypothetical protein